MKRKAIIPRLLYFSVQHFEEKYEKMQVTVKRQRDYSSAGRMKTMVGFCICQEKYGEKNVYSFLFYNQLLKHNSDMF